MKSFNEKLDAILSKKKTVLTESEERYGTNSPTQVKPEKGEDVTKGVIDGHGKIDATGPIPTGAVDTLKTTPGVSPTEGPTGHLPTNADLPRKQLGGVDKDNKILVLGNFLLLQKFMVFMRKKMMKKRRKRKIFLHF